MNSKLEFQKVTCTIEIIEGADHSYTHKELELGEIIKKSFKRELLVGYLSITIFLLFT